MSGDNWNFNGSNPCVYRGGNYGRNDNHGLFYRNYTNATNTNGNHGSRVLRLRKLRIERLCLTAKAFSLRCSASPHATRIRWARAGAPWE